MLRRIRDRLTYANVAATVALFVALGGAAWATIPDSTGVIHGCISATSGNLKVVDPPTTNCAPSEAALDWNQQGPPGAPGSQGSPGVGFNLPVLTVVKPPKLKFKVPQPSKTGQKTVGPDGAHLKKAFAPCDSQSQHVLAGGFKTEPHVPVLVSRTMTGTTSAPKREGWYVEVYYPDLDSSAQWSLTVFAMCD